MPAYKVPMDDMRFVLNEVLKISELSKYKGLEMMDDETIAQIMNEGAKMAEDVLAPLNQSGDHEGCHYNKETGDVTTPKGFKEAYKTFKDAYWTGLSADAEYGGMGMPRVIDATIKEMFCAANMSFSMYPGLAHGAYHALHAFGTEAQKNLVLPKLISGEWSGTMCLTEPGCGTDLGLMKTKAIPQKDGTYKIHGEKIFISAGNHDLTDNIMHLVLAKIDDKNLPDNDKTPEGIKGVSLFLVSKKQLDENGNPAIQDNQVRCSGIEKKLGVHANATCTMVFDGASAELIGDKHKGMRAMFVMMNDARLNVGIQSVALAEASYQAAVEYAQNRLQGKSLSAAKTHNNHSKADPIIVHAGVRQELLSMKAMSESGRMLTSWVALQQDIAKYDPDQETAKKAENLVALLTPIVKAHLSDNAVDATNMGIQIFGGHGFIEESGMAQYNRDARITRIYEGTNGIQSLDLLGRKIMQQGLLNEYFATIKEDIQNARKTAGASEFTAPLRVAYEQMEKTTHDLISRLAHKSPTEQAELISASAMDYLHMMSHMVMSHMWMKMAETSLQQIHAGAPNQEFYQAKLNTARFYNARILPKMQSYAKTITAAPETLSRIASQHFTRSNGTVGQKTLPSKARKPSLGK